MRRAFTLAACFVAVLVAVKIAQAVSGADLASYGVFPRRLDGLGGVLWAPLIHGSWTHLIGNAAALVVLATTLLYGYPRSARIVLPTVWIAPGLAVWLFARPAWHIGASGIAFGLLFFVFTIGVLRWDRRAIALAMVVSFLYGSMVWGILPHDPSVSFETHLAGAITGVALAFALRWRDPPPPRRRYSWEDEEDDAPAEDTGDVERERSGDSSPPAPGTTARERAAPASRQGRRPGPTARVHPAERTPLRACERLLWPAQASRPAAVSSSTASGSGSPRSGRSWCGIANSVRFGSARTRTS